MANIGRGGERFAPLIITLFFFILYANLLGLLPLGGYRHRQHHGDGGRLP